MNFFQNKILEVWKSSENKEAVKSVGFYYFLSTVGTFIFGGCAYEIFSSKPLKNWHAWLEIWNQRDGARFYKVMMEGYEALTKTNPDIIKFPPLLPWLGSFFAPLFQGDHLLSLFFVSGTAAFAAGWFLFKLILLDYDISIAKKSVWYFFIFPTSYFLHIGYSEALFIALMLGAFWAARKNYWIWAGILGGISGLSRINSVILILALSVEAFMQFRADKKWGRRTLGIFLVSIGFLGYLWFNYQLNGDPLSFLHHQMTDLYRKLAFPWVGILNTIRTLAWRSSVERHMVVYQELLFTGLGIITMIWGLRRIRLSYSIWMIGNLLLFLSNSFILAIPRYSLVLFPIFLAFAHLSSRHEGLGKAIQAWCFLSMAVFIALFVQGRWAF